MNRRKLSWAALKVLSVFLSDPTQEFYGFEIAREADISSGSLYPVLERFEDDFKWLTSRWEEIDSSIERRRPRRYYHLTALGVLEGTNAIRSAQQIMKPALGGLL